MISSLHIIIFFICANLCAQSNDLVGEYYLKVGNDKEHLIEYTLEVKEDGTFLFHAYENHKKGIPWERNKYGKGQWKLDGKIVSFFTNSETDLDEKYTLDFSNSRARFVTKSSRDKTKKVVATRLQFFESEIFWIERLGISKK